MNDLKIEYLPIDSLTPYERNAKEHPQEQIEQIKRSIKDNGMNDPIGIWGKNNTIVEGHGRLIACKELGIDTVPCIRLDHMTDEQRRQYTLIHNQTTMNSGWDVDVVELELADMPDFDAEFYGFEVGEDVSPDEFGEDFDLPDGEKPEIVTMTFTLHNNQKSLVDYAISTVEDDISETFGNTNKNGNAIYEVVRQWAELRK